MAALNSSENASASESIIEKAYLSGIFNKIMLLEHP
jgi:hypothetical protein